MAPPPPRHSLGALFFVLAVVFGGIAAAAAEAVDTEPGLVVVVVAAGAIALWLLPLGIRNRRRPQSGVVSSARGEGRDTSPVARIQEDEGPGEPRSSDPHVRTARQVRGRPTRQRPARSRRRERPRLLRPARPDRRDRA